MSITPNPYNNEQFSLFIHKLYLEYSNINPIEILYSKFEKYFHINTNFLDYINIALEYNLSVTFALLFYDRDCNKGNGNKQNFIEAMSFIGVINPHLLKLHFKNIPIYGCYSDLFKIINVLNNKYKDHYHYHIIYDFIIEYICNQLTLDINDLVNGQSISMLAKWIPSEKKSMNKKIKVLESICKKIYNIDTNINSYYYMKFRKEYLRPLRQKLNLLETHMCNHNIENIKNFEYIPYRASNKYHKYLKRNNIITQNYKNIYNNDSIVTDNIMKTINFYDIINLYSLPNSIVNERVEQQWKLLLNELLIYDNNKIVVYNCTNNYSISHLITILLERTVSDNSLYYQLDNITNNNIDFSKIDLAKLDNKPHRIYILVDKPIDDNIYQIKFHYNTDIEIVVWNMSISSNNILPITIDNNIIYVNGYNNNILEFLIKTKKICIDNIINYIILDKRYKDINILNNIKNK